MKIINFVLIVFVCCNARQFKELRNGPSEIEKFQNEYSNRIAFGESANIGDFSHMLAMISATTEVFVCGASAIHKLWAITAAHCVASLHPFRVKFRGGSAKRQSGGSIFIIENFWIHHQYDDWRLAFDIAVVKVSDSTPIEGINIKPIGLPSSCDALCCGVCTGVEVTALGWGLNENVLDPENLSKITTPVFDHENCKHMWINSAYRLSLGPDYFCQTVNEGKGTCRGDSGSPIIIGENQNKIQVGIVSFATYTCGEAVSLPSGFLRLEYSPIRNWIKRMTGV
ncbi:unnamed protein product [Chironomus riparius]|uniref:Peptidase S1 domain-containing protein n=1 Tax=Chironomus riparius TaxID=315576 RepID=A0A9N9RND1_9DIPT|nr:unnamed protein product [Chironomus riparius]